MALNGKNRDFCNFRFFIVLICFLGPRIFQYRKNGHERGPDGAVCAETFSKRRPEAQDHFPTPPGPKNPIKKGKKNPEILKIPIFAVQSHQLYVETPDKPLWRLLVIIPPHLCGDSDSVVCEIY